MEYIKEKKEIMLERELSKLDKLVLNFIRILKKYVDYVIISGYISILLGRSRATEDVDLFIKKINYLQFYELNKELEKNNFECLNSGNPEEIFSYLNTGLAVRYSRKRKPIPNFEIKFPKKNIDEETFKDFIKVFIKEENLKISSLERHIAFKKYFLKSDKDMEDALHIEELFEKQLDYEKINKLKSILESGE
jgi:hypothetical protein